MLLVIGRCSSIFYIFSILYIYFFFFFHSLFSWTFFYFFPLSFYIFFRFHFLSSLLSLVFCSAIFLYPFLFFFSFCSLLCIYRGHYLILLSVLVLPLTFFLCFIAWFSLALFSTRREMKQGKEGDRLERRMIVENRRELRIDIIRKLADKENE